MGFFYIQKLANSCKKIYYYIFKHTNAKQSYKDNLSIFHLLVESKILINVVIDY